MDIVYPLKHNKYMSKKHREFRAKKSLGQNFLLDENVIRKIINEIQPQPGDSIVEVGPGFGALTGHLLDSGCDYTGVEVDKRLIDKLIDQFGHKENFRLLHQDFRKLNLSKLQSKPALVRVVGNIPYHITSSIIFAAFEQHHILQDMILMVQKEVAQRIVADFGNKQYGILSIISQTFSTAEILFTISPHVFTPKPEVDSAIVKWDFRTKRVLKPQNTALFRSLIKSVFNQRRKTLRNTLKKICDINIFAGIDQFDLQKRPEELAVDEFIRLANFMDDYSKKAEERRR